MNKTKICWPWENLYTFNPVIGCKHNCPYCYARKISNRFGMIPKWEEPQFFEDRLKEPLERSKPSNIFVGSMCDLFGKWVPAAWINAVLRVAREAQQHTFIFLTKNPIRYHEFRDSFPPNSWLGVTVTSEKDFYRSWEILGGYKIFLSIEPVLGKLMSIPKAWDLVIVGADSTPGAAKPNPEWIESIKHHNIFYKPNVRHLVKRTGI